MTPRSLSFPVALSGMALAIHAAVAQPAQNATPGSRTGISPPLPPVALNDASPSPPQRVAEAPISLWPPTQRAFPVQRVRPVAPWVQPAPPAPPLVEYAPPVPVGPPPPPPVTYALVPGHWQLQGARYVWIPPDRVPRLVVDRVLVPNHYVWRGGRWVFVPQHYAAP